MSLGSSLFALATALACAAAHNGVDHSKAQPPPDSPAHLGSADDSPPNDSVMIPPCNPLLRGAITAEDERR
jgi:hypothetical protein